MHGAPVTIHDNELFLIEKGFSEGWMKPRVPALRSGKKVAVVGSGPAGLAVADQLNHPGHSVTVFERDDEIGGLLMYGIPNMKLDKKYIDRRVKLMKDEGVEFVLNANIKSQAEAKKILDGFDAVCLCCGAKKARALTVPGIQAKGVYFAVDWLKSITKSLLDSKLSDKSFVDAKDKNVIILGGGDTANDCAGSAIRLGCKSVTQIEMMPCPPTERAADNPWPEWPKVLKVDYGAQESIYKFGKDPRVWKTTIKEVYAKDKNISGVKTVQVEFKNVDGKRTLCEIDGTEKDLPCDLLLIAAGFLGAEEEAPKAFGVPLSARNTVQTVEQGKYQTAVSKVFSCGDMRRGQSLVVWAIAEGRECAREVDQYLMGYTSE